MTNSIHSEISNDKSCMTCKTINTDFATTKCPLCGGLSVIYVETIKANDLMKEYKRSMDLDVSLEFGTLKEFEYNRCIKCDLHYYSPAILGSESFYEQLQKNYWYYLDNKQEYSIGNRYIGSGDSVLEVGCGKGAFAKLIKTDNYVGLELSRNAQTMAEEKGIHVINESLETHAATHGGHYDVVCSFQVLEHVKDPGSFINVCIECLKPGGILILSVPSDDSFLSIAENLILNMPPHHLTRWSDKSLMWVLDKHGLEYIALEHETLADIHVGWYSNEMVKAVIKKMFRISPQLLNISFTNRLFDRLCTLISSSYAKLLTCKALRPDGHSVTLVARKPCSVLRR